MMKLIAALAIVLGWAAAASAAEPSPLKSLQAIVALTNAEARQALPVAFEATVTYFRGYENLLFVQEGDACIFVRPAAGVALAPGDRILVRGATQGSFRPIVIAASLTLLHHGPALKPLPTRFDELIRGINDSRLVSLHAVVRAADIVLSGANPVRSARLQLLSESGHFEANVDCDDESALKDLLDSEVDITGVAAGKFDNKMQQTGVVLYVSSLADIKVLNRAGASPWSLPATPMDKILAVYNMRDLTPRVRVEGTITYYQPGSAIVLQAGSKSLWIATHTREPLQIGDEADATGFPDAHDRLLTLTDAEIRDSHIPAPVPPQQETWMQLAFWSPNRPDGHQNDLVSIDGVVVTDIREAAQDEYVLESDGRLFTAIYRHPFSSGTLPAMLQIPLGSRIRVTGICMVADPKSVNPGDEVPFNILLRSFSDITVLANPSLLNVRNLLILVGVLLAIVFAVGARGWLLERRVRRQTTVLSVRTEAVAALEQRRSRILEDINGSRPLAEIIEEIAALASFKLNGAPCWCQIADGARLGAYPQESSSLRVIHEEIPARSGAPLGTIFAGLKAGSEPQANEREALAMSTGLATLAIETRRLYDDLMHRSEFDLLTDIHNRFSLDKYLDAQIEVARSNAHIFGLIYIDLDEFKQVNDIYGHKVGDLFLQEVAVRMKRQLRAHDMLARLGGDEFAVLLAVVRSRADVEEVALRLEHSLDEPFVADGYTMHGAASVGIAIYPEDATTKDGLLSSADAAMYVAKYTKRQSPPDSSTSVGSNPVPPVLRRSTSEGRQ
jgi:diguanylate cyclase (GGDEF)-like protein